jgi:hypothetical protein
MHVLSAPTLWQSARAMLMQLFALIGTTNTATLARLKPSQRARVLAWLDALEIMVRKVLLIEASALERRRPRRRDRSTRKIADEGAGAPVQRIPSFALIPAGLHDKRHPARIRALGPATSVAEIWADQERAARIARLRNSTSPEPGARLANRIAALASVIANPAPHARRLARLMQRKAQAASAILIARLKSTPPDFHLDAYEAANASAHRAIITLSNSS